MSRKAFVLMLPVIGLTAPALAQPSSAPYAANPAVAGNGLPPQAHPQSSPWNEPGQYLLFGEPWLQSKSAETYRQREDGTLNDAQQSLARLIDRRDYRRAASAARSLAEHGDIWATRHLGWMYLHGLGVRRDAGTAVELLEAAARHGDAPAALALGAVYREGIPGVARDRERSATWLRRAEASNASEVQREARRLRHRN